MNPLLLQMMAMQNQPQVPQQESPWTDIIAAHMAQRRSDEMLPQIIKAMPQPQQPRNV